VEGGKGAGVQAEDDLGKCCLGPVLGEEELQRGEKKKRGVEVGGKSHARMHIIVPPHPQPSLCSPYLDQKRNNVRGPRLARHMEDGVAVAVDAGRGGGR